MKKCYPKHFPKSIFGYTVIAVGLFILFNPTNYVQGQVASFSTPGTGQQFTVPPNVTSIQVKAWGAAGGSYCCGTPYANVGGAGGFAGATLAVTPSETLIIDVGGGGTLAGGINGGGPGIYSGGGGGTDIRRDTTYLLVAGGGGGSGNGDGGAGGGATGGASTVCSGVTSGGTQTSGGIQQSCSGNATDGSFHQGGEGEEGGGGGGWYGGGGGSCGCGGGGGSGYVTGTCTSLLAAPGFNQSYGYVGVEAANSTDPDYNGTAGMAVVNGDTTGVYSIEAPGYPGLLVIRYGTATLGTPSLVGDTLPCSLYPITYKTDVGMSNYSWSVIGGTIVSGGSAQDDSIVIAWDTTGTVSVSFFTCNASSPITTLKVTPSILAITVTVSAVPADAVCPGVPITFSATVTNGGPSLSYQWQLNGNNVGGDSATLDLDAQNNNDSIRCIVGAFDGCGQNIQRTSSPYAEMVNPLPTPVINATDTLICANDSSQLCTSGNFSNYLWNTQDTSSCIEAKNAGGYWVTVTDTNGCTNSSAHINIYVYPVSQASVSAKGDTLSSFNAVTYQWYFNEEAIPGADSSTEIARETGNYAVQVTDTNGCVATSTNVYITVTGIIGSLLSDGQVQVYPNPANGQVFITSNGVINEIRLYNIMGQEVRSLIPGAGGGKTIRLEITGLPSGIYELQIDDKKAVIFRKLSIN